MRNGVLAVCLLALGLIGSACGAGHKATPSSYGGGYGQPSSAPPESSPPAESSPPMSSPPMSSPPMSAPPSAGAVTINVGTVSLGKILVDGKGMTLYLFEKDKRGGPSTCSGACAALWPPVISSGKVTAGSGVKASWLGLTTRSDGTKQVTYNGWPLYHYAKDKKAGETTGQDLTSFGAPWYVVSPEKGAKLEK